MMLRIYNRTDQKEKRHNLRENMTQAEVVLWRELKNRSILNQKFVRQFSVGVFVVDFYCRRLKLAIEVDGGVHEGMAAKIRDKQREQWLERFGIKVVRYTNEQVFECLDAVMQDVQEQIRMILPLPREGGNKVAGRVEL